MHPAVALRRLLAGFCLACVPLVGCAGFARPTAAPETVAPAQPANAPAAVQPVQPASHETPATTASAIPKEVPITLDAVLRIAEQTNAKIGGAREKLRESQMNAEQAQSCWMPNVYAGAGYYRHEGGIQDFNGRLIHSSYGAFMPGLQLKTEWDVRETTFKQLDAERKIWQQKAELSQVNSEVLLEAATTYVDLLTARRAEELFRQLERYERKVLGRAEIIAKTESAADALIAGLRSSLSAREYQAAQMRQQGDAASAKLVYLLGLPPLTRLVPVDPVLVPVELLDTTPAKEVLVERALTSGPGVQELTGLMNTIQLGLDKSYSRQNLLPTVEVCVWEGMIAAGPGLSTSVDNRLDVCLHVKWNLTELMQAEDKRAIARSKLEQTRWTLQDVKNRLASTVQEAQNAVHASREMIGLSTAQIQQASRQYELSDKRVEDGTKGASPADVVTAIRALELAHFNYVQATRDHNKAQARLLVLVGHPPANEKKIAPPVDLPPPAPLKGRRDLPDTKKDDKNNKDPEKVPPPKDGAMRHQPPGPIHTILLTDDGLGTK
jgi:outer membrane protein TolC